MHTIRIEASRSYDVTVGSGLLQECGRRIRAMTEAEHAFVVSDGTVFVQYGRTVMERLQGAGFLVSHYVFPQGEKSKNLQTYGELMEWMCSRRLTRNDVVVALGGGVVGDLAGFAAATYARGMDLVQLPTTLLSAVDSSVGGKTAVDLNAGKNMAGAFHQPMLVLCDTDTFRTLPEEQLRNGFAEIVKYAVLGSEELFRDLKDIPSGDRLEDVIARCVSMKRDYVARDEFDRGLRALLNLGHTFGHAAETCSSYSLLHGEAVSMGMAAILRACSVRGICSPETADSVVELLDSYGLPTQIPYGLAEMSRAVLSDKKRSGSRLTLVVPERIGCCRTEIIDADDVSGWLKDGGVT